MLIKNCRYKWFSDYNCLITKISEVTIKIPGHAKYITTPEFNKLTADYFTSRSKQANLVLTEKLSQIKRNI